ncbi:hypothetical protein Tco_0544984, partial [Tanacetum coccineum]
NFSKYIFDNMVKNLEGGVKFLMYPRFVQVFLDKQVEGITKHKEIYVTPSHTKKVFANMKRGGKGFSGRVTSLFQTMMVQAPEELGKGLEIPTDLQHTPTIIQPSTSQPQKKQPRRKQRKYTEVPQPSGSTEPITDETANAEHVPTYSNDLFFSGDDRLKLNELMELCTKLSERVLDLENTNKLERRNKSRTSWLKRLRKVGRSAQVVSSEDKEVTLVDEAQGRNNDYLMFDTGVFHEQEVKIEKAISTAEVTTIKASKPKVVTTTATITTTAVTRPKAKGVVVQEPSEFRTTTSSSQISQDKDKGKAKMIEPEKPLKKKDQFLIDEEIAQKLQDQINVELEEEEKLAKQREEDENITEWDYVQAMIDVDYELAARLQAQEQEELTVEEKSKVFVELMDKRKKHFTRLRAKEQRRKPPTKAQKRNQMCTYLKNMAGFTHNSFVSMDSEVVKGGKEKDKGNVTRAEESSSKRAGIELEQERIKKQKIDDDQEEAEMKKHMEIVVDEEEIAVDAIPLATKPLIIVDWKIIKKGKMGYFQLIRADGSSRRPEEAYERVLWGDLKVMFEPDIESDVWRNLQGYNVIVWKLFSSSGVHFVRFQNMYIFMLVEKKYPLTPATITKMLNKKLQNDHWNEGRIVGIKRLHDDLGVNTAKVRVTTAKHNLLRLLRDLEEILLISAAGIKVNAAAYNC